MQELNSLLAYSKIESHSSNDKPSWGNNFKQFSLYNEKLSVVKTCSSTWFKK
jgi:hypothetical protein